jgi:hypothetical protein
MITWIDKKSVLMLANRKIIKAGQEVPAGILSDARIEVLRKQKKIKAVVSDVEPAPVKPEKVAKPAKPVKVVEPEPEIVRIANPEPEFTPEADDESSEE